MGVGGIRGAHLTHLSEGDGGDAGEQYQELRGVMLECEVAVHRDLDVVKSARP